MNPLQRALQILKGGTEMFLPASTRYVKNSAQGVRALLGDEDERKKLIESGAGNPQNILKEQDKVKAELLSYLVPFGKGSNFVSKFAVPGAVSGALTTLSRPKTDAKTATTDIGTSAIASVLFGKSGEALNKGLKKIGTNLITKSEGAGRDVLGLTSLDVNDIEKRFGTRLPELLKKYKIFGSDVEGIQKAIDPIQQQFDSIAENPNLKIGSDDYKTTFEKAIKELSESSFPELQKKGQSVKTYLDNFLTNNKSGEFGADMLTKERRLADQLVRDFSNEGATRSSNNLIRETIQNTIREGADKAGMAGEGGKKLSELGGDLNVLYSILEKGQKRANKSRKFLNTITSALGAGVGGSFGGIPGATAGYVMGNTLSDAANSPTGVKTISNLLNNTGEVLNKGVGLPDTTANTGIKALLNLISGGPITENNNQQENTQPNEVSQNSMKKLVNPQNNTQPQTQMQEQFDPNEEITLLDGSKSTYGQLQQTGVFSSGQVQGAQDSPAPISDEQFQQLFIADLIKNGGKNLDKLTMLQKVISPQEDIDTQIKKAQLQKMQAELTGTDQKPLTAAAENKVQLATSGLRALDSIEAMIAEDPSKVLKSLVPGKIGARDYDSAAFRAVEGLLRARSGAAIPETEVRRYMSANLPKFGDSQKEIEFKLSAFRKDLEDVTRSGGGTDQEALLKMLGL